VDPAGEREVALALRPPEIDRIAEEILHLFDDLI
jgi:hypothetical protein